MSAATILFTDVVSFSRKPTSEQKRIVEALTTEVIYEIRPLLYPPENKSSVIALPTGDGVALAFLHNPNKQWDCQTLLRIIVRLHKWAFENSKPGNVISLRVGVHVGAVEIITDINCKANVCGDTINYAQRVMDAANPGQTLFSEAAFREYVGSESPELKCFDHTFKVKGPIEVYAKHKLQILVYKLVLEPEQEFWNNSDPIAKQLMLVSLTPLPKDILGSFAENIGKATQIAFIQVTGERFLNNYKDGKVCLSNNLNRFWVFMPNPSTHKDQYPTAYKATPEQIEEFIVNWKELLKCIKDKYPSADVKLGLYSEPPFFGASFIDWERPEGKIHVSPYIWSVPVIKCPGYDMEWIGKRPSPIFETYVQGLQYLNSTTKNSLFSD